MPLPAAVQYGAVKWSAVSAVADSDDADTNPDAVPVTGTVTFTPSTRVLLAPNGAPPVTVFANPIEYHLDDAGVLRDTAGRDTVTLVATDSPNLTPVGWTWKVDYRLNKIGGTAVSRGSFSFALPTGATVDLTTVAPVASSGGVPIIQGPPGASGSAYPMVVHDANAAHPRPDADEGVRVFWFGSVRPTAMNEALDVWVRTEQEEL